MRCLTVYYIENWDYIENYSILIVYMGRRPCGVGTSSLDALAGGWVNKTSLYYIGPASAAEWPPGFVWPSLVFGFRFQEEGEARVCQEADLPATA